MRIFLSIFLIINYLNATDVSLALSWKHQFQFAGYYVAKEKGFYKDAGLNVSIEEYVSNRDVAKDVATLKYDFGVRHSSLILDKINRYQNILMLSAINQSSPMVLLAKKDTDIKTLTDIYGKKIMISNDQATMASINAMLFSEKLRQNSFEAIPTSFNPIDIVNGNADLMTSYSSNEPFTLQEKGIACRIFDPKEYGYDFYSDILFTSSELAKSNPKLVDDFYKATIKGWEYAYSHIEESSKIIINKYNTQNKSLEALLFEAKTLKKLSYADGIKFGDINLIKLKEIATTYRLLGLIKTKQKINFKDFLYKSPNKESLKTTKIEHDYLLKKEHLKICINPDDMPFQGIEDNKLIGITSHFLSIFKNDISASFDIIKVANKEEAVSFLKNKQCDIIPVFHGSIHDDELLRKTTPYINIPLTIVTHKDSDYTFHLEDVKTKPIGIVRNRFQKNDFSNMNILNQSSTDDGINNVLSKNIFGFIGDIISVKRYINTNAVSDVQLRNINKVSPIHMLIRADDKILFNVLEKRIRSIDNNAKHIILNKWMNAEYVKNYDYKLLLLLLVIILVIVLFGFYIKLHMNKLLKLKTDELNESMKIFNQNIGASHTDTDGKITYVNEAFCKKSGYTKDELIGQRYSLLRDKDTPESMYKDLWMTIKSGHTWRGEIKNRAKDSTEYWVNSIISPMFDKNKNIIGFSSIVEDITLEKVLATYNQKLEAEVKQRTKELEEISITDKLTNVYNRVKLDSSLTLYVNNYERYQQIFSLLILDIDHFKNINDTYGHLVGDEILKKIASLLKSSIRSVDILGRWGGEEFMIICPNSNTDGAIGLAENIRKTIQNYTFSIGDSITVSIGVSEISSAMTENDIIHKADNALYKAKQSGRNKVIKG